MRLVALALLALVALFLGATGVDACDESGNGAGGDCPPGCHVSCRDGCGSVPVTVPQELPPAGSLDHAQTFAAAARADRPHRPARDRPPRR